jgi:hypothetical protein
MFPLCSAAPEAVQNDFSDWGNEIRLLRPVYCGSEEVLTSL